MAGRRMASMHVASGDGAPAPQSAIRWRASLLRLSRRAAAPALGAGLTATVLAGALIAGGPAAASVAPPAAHAGTPAHAATAALASRTPAARAVARALLSVSCPSATHCVAVGARSAKANGTVSPLTEVWNGSTWTAVTAPR